jgi:ribosomal protein S18 acetylase RimI-like enzyme
MERSLSILDFSPEHRASIRKILTNVGWAEQYILAMEEAVDVFSQDPETYGVYLAFSNDEPIGYLYIQYYAWNHMCQIQGLAVDPAYQRQGVASALVERAEAFARSKNARGVYVDTPTTNNGGRKFYESVGYRFGYLMPRYYEDGLDGVTYQKFLNGTNQ